MMFGLSRRRPARLWIAAIAGLALAPGVRAQEPPALNPFGEPAERNQRRDDAVPGYLELSDGSLHPGLVFLTRETRLKILDDERKAFREVPLKVIRRIDGIVVREWNEREWRFRENASDEKVYTGRTYPAREYTHKITLQDGRTIRGPLSGIVYVQPEAGAEPDRFLLHTRDKGEPGTSLKSLVYVRSIRLGAEALREGERRARGTKPARRGKKAAHP
ncbi:MAG: hypothetical protein ACYC61_01555 [Isosphaeraceae bacterium]